MAEKYEDVTAMVGMNDMVAIGVMDALVEKKYRIPYDYSVCGCDNTMISQYRTISMTSVEHFDANRGREAVDVLIRKIEEGLIEEKNDKFITNKIRESISEGQRIKPGCFQGKTIHKDRIANIINNSISYPAFLFLPFANF